MRGAGDAGQDVREPGLRVDVVELCRHDQCRHDGGAIGTALGAGEEPGLAAEGKAAQCALRRIVGQADSPVRDEAGEPIPAAQLRTRWDRQLRSEAEGRNRKGENEKDKRLYTV